MKILNLFCSIALLLLIFSCTSDPTAAVEDTSDPKILEDKEVEMSKDLQNFIKEAASDGMMEVEMAEIALERSGNGRVQEFARDLKKDHEQANEELKNILAQLDTDTKMPNNMLPRHEKKVERLEEFSDETFDRHYLEIVVASHEEAVEKFEKMAAVYGEGSQHQATKQDRTSGTERMQPRGEGDTAGGKVSAERASDRIAEDTQATNGDPHYAFRNAGHQQVHSWAEATLPKLRMHLQRSRELQQEIPGE